MKFRELLFIPSHLTLLAMARAFRDKLEDISPQTSM